MFTHLLVPLDGSGLAEAALPPAAALAQALGASVTLLHVIERHAPQAVHGERHLTDAAEAQAYLDAVAARAFPPGVRVERHVHADEVGDVARSVVEHSGELRPDLIVLCTHGRGGLRQMVLGSIAQRVVALGTTPVLLVRPAEDGSPRPFACRRLLVPLDGVSDHEQGLCIAQGLAKACGAALHLVTIVPTPGTLSGEQAAVAQLLPHTAAAILDEAEDGSAAYLRRCVERAQAGGLTLTAEVRRGDPAPAIVAAAEQAGADLIVLGTHGRAGLDAFWSGSVAPKLPGLTAISLLFVPVL
jgi:nucleotide-binding universal stress UspA family protein